MTTISRVDVRWSTAATICPRQAVYAATRDEQPQHPEHVLRRFARGTRLGKLMGEEVAAEPAEDATYYAQDESAAAYNALGRDA